MGRKGDSFVKLLFWTDPNDNIEIIEATKEAADKYGHHFGSEIIRLNSEHIQALRDGKMLAWDDGEYTTFLVFQDD